MTDVNEPLLIRKKRTDEDQHSFGEQDEEEEGLRTDYGSGVYRYPAYLQPGHFTSLEKLMFFLSSILLILLFIFVGLYARSSQMDEDPLIPLPTKPDNHTKEQAYCLESNCIITAAQILEDVDRELDPCDDFYAYTCNKWQETHLIPDVKSSIDMPSITRDAIRHRLDQILNRDFNRLHKVSPHLPDPDRILDRQLFTKLSDFYHACMDQDMIEKVNIKPLYPLFRAIRDFIPLKQDPVDAEGLHRALSYLADRNIWTLFEMKVEPDPYQPTRPSLSLSQGQVGLPDRALYDDPDTMSVYMQVVTSMLDYVFKQDSTNEFGWRSWSAVATARRIIEFEKKVATTIVQRQPESWSLEQLEQAAPAIQWTRFIEQHRPQLPVPTHILVPTSGFMDHLTQDVLSTTNPRTLQMYFIWRTLWKYLDALDEPLVALKRPLDVKLSGIEPRATLERRDVCIDLIDASALGILMGRYFVLDHEDRILKSKASIQTMTAHIVKAFESRVSYLDWIPQGDDQTRHEILQKLATMEFQIGFPSDLQSVISLSDYLGPIQMDKTDFFGNMMRSNQHQVKQTWQLLQQPIDRHAWKVNAHSVKMAYDRELNKVMIPAGLLQLPYFDPEGPSYLYVGAIGWMIGHEIMHAFDTLGRRYNDKGIYGQWWSNNTPDQCLVSQYQAYGVDGNKTLDNNIADHGGLVLLESLIDHFENISIPGLNHHWNQDQLAYLQFARLKCSKSTKEHKSLVKDVAPDQLRVNGPLINSNRFAKVFGCKKGSFMNPVNQIKCQFGKQLETEAEDIPSEWRPYLIQYKALKKMITKVAEEIESRGLSALLLHECLEDDITIKQEPESNTIPKIKYYFIGEAPNVKPCIEFSYDPNEPRVQEMLSTLLDSEKDNQIDRKPKLEYKRSIHNKDVFSLSNRANQDDHCIQSPAIKSQRRHSTAQLVKELVNLVLNERENPKEQAEKEQSESKTLIVELEQDDEFFKLLLTELEQAAELQDVTAQQFEKDIYTLENKMTRVAAPQKSDMYHWRKIFSIYMDAQIFRGNTEVDHTFRSVERAKKQMTWFLEQLNRADLLKKLKTKESKSAFEQFISLNTELITIKHYQMLNQTAMRKILKKHDKRSGLTASQSFPELVSTDHLFSPKLASMLYATITNRVTNIIPQPEDYACPVCMSVAWRPIRLACQHVFCVRCLIKAQKQKMDSCPLCRHPTAVRTATALNLDEGLQNFLKLYFPQEIKEKKRENEREQAIEDVQAMTGKRYTKEQLIRMSQQSNTKCLVM